MSVSLDLGRQVSPFARVAPGLTANGYSVLPILPRSKAPGEFVAGSWREMHGWNSYRDRQAHSFMLRLWASWPETNVGVVLGVRASSTHEFGAIDFDTDDIVLCEQMEASLPRSRVRKRGNRGYTAFFLVPVGTRGRKFKRQNAVICEILTGTNVRQTVIPPSLHPLTGRPYEWLTAATLENTRLQELDVLTQDDLDRFIDTLEHICGLEEDRRPTPTTAAPEDESPFRRLNNAALTNLEAWVPQLNMVKLRRTAAGYAAVAHWRASGSGRPLEQRSPNLGISRTAGAAKGGIKDFGTDETHTALNLVMLANAWDREHAFPWLAARLGYETDAFAALEIPAQPPQIVEATADGTRYDGETGEVLTAAEAKIALPPPIARARPAAAADELPDALTRAPGLLGEMVDWIVSTARRPNRVLALGAAITSLGTLIGQRTGGPTLSGTHLYVVALAPSGAGKDHPLRQVMELMKAANAPQLIGPDEFISMPAVIHFLERQPLSVCPMDEIGAFLARLSHHRASAYERSVTKMLRTAWGASFKSMTTPEWGSKPMREIYFPAMSIFGVSTPAEFFSALEGADIVNGFLNRFLLLSTSARVRDVTPKLDPLALPAGLSTRLARLFLETRKVQAEDMNTPVGTPLRPRLIGWGAGAQDVHDALVDEIETLREDVDLDPYYARTVEMALRLATIRAAGQGAAALDGDDMAWGRDLALWSARSMHRLAMNYIAENETHALSNRVMRALGSNNGCLTSRELARALGGSVRSRDLKDVLEQLMEAGRVKLEKITPPTGGTPSRTYKLV